MLNESRIAVLDAIFHGLRKSGEFRLDRTVAFFRRRVGGHNQSGIKAFLSNFGSLRGLREKARAEWNRQSEISANRHHKTYGVEEELSLADRIKKRIETQEAERLRRLYPLRKGSSAWAGGCNTFTFSYELGSVYPHLKVYSEKVWSSNGKWPGKNYSYHMSLPPSMTWGVIGGLLTVWKRSDMATAKACFWAVQGRGMEANFKEGFLVRDYHSTAKTAEKALREYKKARASRLVALRRERIEKVGEAALLARTFVCREDSIAGGNCAAGTDAFFSGKVAPQYGEIGAIRADILLGLEDSRYTRNAIRAAIQRSEVVSA